MDECEDLRVRHQLPGGYHLVVDDFDFLDADAGLQKLGVGLRLVSTLCYSRRARKVELGLGGRVLHLHPDLAEVGGLESGHTREFGLEEGHLVLGRRLRLGAEAAEYVVEGLG